MNTAKKQRGSVNPLLIASSVLGVLVVALAGLSVWAVMNYMDQKNNTDEKINVAVTQATDDQKKRLTAQFIEDEKKPYVAFNGPDDLGHVSFDYPKTWSVYVAKDGSAGGGYEAYLHPVAVPTVSTTTPYATRVVIEDRDYEAVLKSYESLVKRGTLKSEPITANDVDGVRLSGEFSKQRTGSAVIFKVRDKTLIAATDSTSFQKDFDNVIVKTLTFNR